MEQMRIGSMVELTDHVSNFWNATDTFEGGRFTWAELLNILHTEDILQFAKENVDGSNVGMWWHWPIRRDNGGFIAVHKDAIEMYFDSVSMIGVWGDRCRYVNNGTPEEISKKIMSKIYTGRGNID